MQNVSRETFCKRDILIGVQNNLAAVALRGFVV